MEIDALAKDHHIRKENRKLKSMLRAAKRRVEKLHHAACSAEQSAEGLLALGLPIGRVKRILRERQTLEQFERPQRRLTSNGQWEYQCKDC